jgi:hypothetical protein
MRTPSMVRLVSAMLVARTILRRPAFPGPQRRVLVARRQLAEQWQHVHVGAEHAQHSLHAAYFTGARQEHQHVARRLDECTPDRAHHGEFRRLAATRQRRHAGSDVMNLDGEHAARGGDHRRVT